MSAFDGKLVYKATVTCHIRYINPLQAVDIVRERGAEQRTLMVSASES